MQREPFSIYFVGHCSKSGSQTCVQKQTRNICAISEGGKAGEVLTNVAIKSIKERSQIHATWQDCRYFFIFFPSCALLFKPFAKRRTCRRHDAEDLVDFSHPAVTTFVGSIYSMDNLANNTNNKKRSKQKTDIEYT